MTINMFFFRFSLKVLELFECRRGDPCMTANRNFVRFAHSLLICRSTLDMYIDWSSYCRLDFSARGSSKIISMISKTNEKYSSRYNTRLVLSIVTCVWTTINTKVVLFFGIRRHSLIQFRDISTNEKRCRCSKLLLLTSQKLHPSSAQNFMKWVVVHWPTFRRQQGHFGILPNLTRRP